MLLCQETKGVSPMVRMFAVLFALATATPYEPVGAVHTVGCLALEGGRTPRIR